MTDWELLRFVQTTELEHGEWGIRGWIDWARPDALGTLVMMVVDELGDHQLPGAQVSIS